MPIFAAVAVIASIGLGAYNSYAQYDYESNALDLAKQRLAQQGILTKAEKKQAEMQINAVTGAATRTYADTNTTVTDQATGQAAASRPPPDWGTLLIYAGGLVIGWFVLKAILKTFR